MEALKKKIIGKTIVEANQILKPTHCCRAMYANGKSLNLEIGKEILYNRLNVKVSVDPQYSLDMVDQHGIITEVICFG